METCQLCYYDKSQEPISFKLYVFKIESIRQKQSKWQGPKYMNRMNIQQRSLKEYDCNKNW